MACWDGIMTQSVRRPKQREADKMTEIVNIGTEGIGILRSISSTMERQADVHTKLAEDLRRVKPKAKGRAMQAPWKEGSGQVQVPWQKKTGVPRAKKAKEEQEKEIKDGSQSKAAGIKLTRREVETILEQRRRGAQLNERVKQAGGYTVAGVLEWSEEEDDCEVEKKGRVKKTERFKKKKEERIFRVEVERRRGTKTRRKKKREEQQVSDSEEAKTQEEAAAKQADDEFNEKASAAKVQWQSKARTRRARTKQ